jgi:hypothetical protein
MEYIAVESIQEAFLLFGQIDLLNDMPLWQKYVLALHAFNTKKGFKLTGFLEDDPRHGNQDTEESKSGITPSEAVMLSLPIDWKDKNKDVASFRYEHADWPGMEQYFKIMVLDETEIEVNAYMACKKKDQNNQLSNLLAATLTMNPMGESNFDNLDSWLP